MPEGLLPVFAAILNALFLVGSIYIYLALVRQIGARTEDERAVPVRTFGMPDVFAAGALGTLFLFSAFAAISQTNRAALSGSDLPANAVIAAGLFLFIAGFLRVRGIDVGALAGFGKLQFWRTLGTGFILLFAAYPLIFVADLVTQRVLGGSSSKQNIVELFSGSETLQQRVLIIILAVAIAPIVEEFVFRFYFYGVVKRYFGRFAGLLVNSLLFAVVHGHVPSAAPLFVLGVCFTLAYEWSGSILVAMTMHALFNSLTLTALAFPDLVAQ